MRRIGKDRSDLSPREHLNLLAIGIGGATPVMGQRLDVCFTFGLGQEFDIARAVGDDEVRHYAEDSSEDTFL